MYVTGRSSFMAVRVNLAAILGLGSAIGALGCTETLKDNYAVEIAGPNDAFQGAVRVSLLVSGQVVATTAVSGTGPFTLEAPDLDPSTTATAIFAIRAEDADGKVVAFGQTPQLEVLHISRSIRIFVQKPGTLARGRDFAFKTKDHVAVPAESGVLPQELVLAVTVPVFGAGRMRVPGAQGTERDVLSNELFIYNPLTHLPEQVGSTTGGLRAEASAVSLRSRVYVFGGLYQSNVNDEPRTTGQLDVFDVAREGLTNFFTQAQAPVDGAAGTARKRAALAASMRPIFAFGGLDQDNNPLDTAVVMDSARQPNPVSVLPSKMSASRVGHTATLVTTNESWGNILVYGGAPPGGSVADLFNPDPLKEGWLTFDRTVDGVEGGAEAAPLQPGHPGTGRREHVAISLPTQDARVLILGGRDDDGKPRGDSLVYIPGRRRFEPGPVTLRHPRAAFVAFVVNDDLVVAGGYGSDGQLLANAEVYDIKSWQFQSEGLAVARARATATVLANLSAIVLGGETADSASNAVEIYQPRR